MRLHVQQAIAILDSGVGGLTVAKEVMRQLPQEQIIYFGDSERSPFGPRPAEEVMRFTKQIVAYLNTFKPKMIVIACNTATAVALDEIRRMENVPVIGVIHPGVRAAIKKTKSNHVGIIGTEGTVKSQAYNHALTEIAPHIQVDSLACPRFVPIVEQGIAHDEHVLEVVKQSLAPIQTDGLDCLILGCTHYPFLTDTIAKVMGPQVELINSAEETAREVSAILYHRGELAKSNPSPNHKFICSGDPVLFQQIAERWLGHEVVVERHAWES
jgi:glutamate racemase